MGQIFNFFYWFIVLVFRTIVTFIITAKLFYNLPSWVIKLLSPDADDVISMSDLVAEQNHTTIW